MLTMENKPEQYTLTEEPAQQMFAPRAPKSLEVFKWVGEWEGNHPWAKMINSIIDMMIVFNQKYPEHQFVIHQIKEKFGTLRFYYGRPRDVPSEAQAEVDDIVDAVRHAGKTSQFLCTTSGCGSIEAKQVSTKSGWIATLCDACAEKELNG